MKLLLASTSPTRRRMLTDAGVPFELVEVRADEEAAKAGLRSRLLSAVELAVALAELKAVSAVECGNALVLGADQTLERDDGVMFDKPGSRAETAAQLRALSGRTHRLHSAAVIVQRGQPVWRHVESVELQVRPLSEAFIERYLDREGQAVQGCVGGYRIEGMGAQLFERITGSHFAILGLPLLPLSNYLRTRGLLPD